ncbi:TonB-dependent receptor [Sphingomonas sp. Tas61C01]|uniref:TonB-dependent receptor n=1 Tax=Sphingomonas sp. Tas61C01 TaxID=3458297 RepID=UPI00403E3C48
MTALDTAFFKRHGTSRTLATTVSAAALALAMASGAQAQDLAVQPAPAEAQAVASEGAQAQAEPAGEDIVVTGIRASLESAQSIKQNSDTFVDAITAQDIGALPDRSVVESLQRIPGVTISKFQGGNDPDHFSAEGTTVQIRGLSQIQTQVNGRDSFTAGFGRTINLADFPAELLSSIEVFKEPTSDMIEGGLGGTVNLNTLKPLDRKGFHAAFDAEANYSDFRDKWSPVASVLVSDTWETRLGTFGLLLDYSYSDLKVRSDGIQATNFQTRDGLTTPAGVLRNRLPGRDVAFAPIGASFRTQDTERKRYGSAVAAQWESPDKTMQLTGQFLRTLATRSWTEHTFETESGLSEYNTYPAGCLPTADSSASCPAGFADYQYDAEGVFEKGYITQPGTGWRSATSGTAGSPTPTGGMQQNLSRRDRFERTVTSDFSLNYKWTPTPRLSVTLDGQYVTSRARSFDFTSYTDTFADEELDLTGGLPVAVPHKPLNNASPNTRIAGQSDAQYFADPANYFWRAAMDHMDESDGKEWAFKGDVSYDVDGDIPFLQKVQAGFRYSDRDQTVRYTPYNWGYVSEVWDGTGDAVYLNQAGQDQAELYRFDDFFQGKTSGPQGWYYGSHQLDNYASASNFFQDINKVWQQSNGGFAGGWVPVGQRAGVVAATPYLPGEIDRSGESTNAAYARLDFGSKDPVFGDVRIRGNVGLRYVETREHSTGSIQFPSNTLGGTYAQICQTGASPPPICARGQQFYDDLVTFSDAGSTQGTVRNKFHHWLPSVNLIVSPTDTFQLRFAASKQIQRPDFGFLRNYVAMSVNSGEVPLTATAGNPYLRPAESKQWDLGAEWFFSKVGSLTFDYFHKSIDGFFYQSNVQRSFTNNGVAQTAFQLAPANFDGTGKIKGFEVGYQQSFDFLPGLFGGLGAGATYSHVVSKGLPNAFLSNVSVAPAAEPSTGRGTLPFEGLSRDNVNVTGFYEKGPLSLRVAYNWRSRFLETAVDEIYPYFPVYQKATGQLDASVFFNLTRQIKIGAQGVNLTNTVTRTEQQFTASGRIGPRSSFITDRRFALILRGSF